MTYHTCVGEHTVFDLCSLGDFWCDQHHASGSALFQLSRGTQRNTSVSAGMHENTLGMWIRKLCALIFHLSARNIYSTLEGWRDFLHPFSKRNKLHPKQKNMKEERKFHFSLDSVSMANRRHCKEQYMLAHTSSMLCLLGRWELVFGLPFESSSLLFSFLSSIGVHCRHNI